MKIKKKLIIVPLLLVFMLGISAAQAATILYVPQDDRPVSLEDVVDTAEAAKLTVLAPPAELIASRDKKGDPDQLWQWVKDHAGQADALILSGDALIYGGLVDSRTHEFGEAVLKARLERFQELQKAHPFTRVYVYSTVLRTPQGSAGGVEPAYYEQYGGNIFQLTALRDKEEVEGLTKKEKKLLASNLAIIPPDALADWMQRRQKNFDINSSLIELNRQGLFKFFLLGRDDTAPYSQSHKESRELSILAADLPQSRFQTFPGADQLGMVLLARAYNDLTYRIPIVKVNYAAGAAKDSIPSYEDQKVGQSIVAHVVAAGGIVLNNPLKPDLIVNVNTSATGKTLEAGSRKNTTVLTPALHQFVDAIQAQVEAGKQVAVADISFANGADNALMTELSRRNLLDKLSAYSGWNTAGNTVGYAVGQGMLTGLTDDQDRKRLLAVRYLDDWAYQANIRQALTEEFVYPNSGSPVYLNELKPQLTAELEKRERQFAEQHLWLPPEQITATFPWNRMFEVNVNIAPE
ncbi:DUF4127 family protein|uniref:DUF4127 domain-containing protein n=1 Tax=Dendrosporobacter quercicolus TaxID=146817 RepID=A0A1G9SHW4_9FIRM|nr:DUF4127 family protein [Dendrosporobacter quercicolus]NSL48713.1 DUF4127 family protein [Dendrosporobacter quercicolus DSM 1736]SDM34992.1 Protein of unknown function [Dendrosporobacter quercicolus]